MEKDDLKSKTSEKLESDLKITKMLTGVLTASLILLIAVNIYGLIFKDNNVTFIALMVVAISLGTLIPSQLSTIKKIKTELKWRENNN